MNIPQDPLKYVERPELTDIYSDNIGRGSSDAQITRIEFCVTRLDEPGPKKKVTGKVYPVSRIALHPNAVVTLHKQLSHFIQVMIKNGILKKEELPTGPIN